jgi:hypothetical protein
MSAAYSPPPLLTMSRRSKYILWTLMACAAMSVLFYSEIPLLHKPQEQAHLHRLRWLLVPHIIAATFALLSGPFQFSSSFRSRYLRAHRIIGRMYVSSVFIAAPLAMLSTLFNDHPKLYVFVAAIFIQGTAWIVTTGVALAAAISRRIPRHQEWMVRSYAMTFTFVGTRVLQPIPAWNHLGRVLFAFAIVCSTALALSTPWIAGRSGLTRQTSTS